MTDLKEKKNVPELRFSGFEKDWERKKIGEVGHFYYGKSAPKWSVTEDAITPCVRYGELYSKFNEVINKVYSYTNIDPQKLKFSKGGEVLVPRVGEKALEFANCSYLPLANVAIGEMISVYNTDENGLFITYCFNSTCKNSFAKVVEGGSVSNLYFRYLEEIDINFPEKEEQKKITSFLLTIDEKITLLEKEKESWEQYKKGSMQKIFSQQIRFIDDNGNQFSEWKDMNLKKILKERKTYLTKNSGIEHVSLTKKGVVPKTARYERDFLVMQEDKKYRITYLNDICYNPANLKFGVICRNKFGTAIFSPIYVTFEIQGDHNPLYFEYFFVRNDFINMIRKFEEGTVYERMAVKPADFLTFNILVPSIGEQQKIASFLSDLDTKIEMINKEITQSKEWKKGLLQKMFI